ncbi:hypothetical protein LTR85_004421 [Meristemomyces frigidus]|nr:hypothetical protein LTR85_004421 [Meristemomyces frigidus]
MARPSIVRADTLDLQDQDNPSASEHQKLQTQNGLAPHQAAELHHVDEERQEEAQSLAEAWNIAGNLTEEPGAIGQAQANAEHEHMTNGTQQDGEEGGEGGESEADGDDDMMDRISSSPSIDDDLEGSGTVSSLSAHHRLGRYGGLIGTSLDVYDDDGGHSGGQDAAAAQMEDNDGHSERSVVVRSDLRPIESPFRRHFFTRSLTNLGQSDLDRSPSLTSIASVDLTDVLLPVDDPLLDIPPSPSGSSSSSWESATDSERDSFDLGRDRDNDDADDAFLNPDPRFVDTGWGGECLREAEDIDFEFVYALHTFVATVEGQANATKGDTMVLLDDSNSYWWLVRVVKDSSIGYLPAEHIETPTERLARLNKHRNIDLSATMLSDNSEKTRNPLKKAMRRRNAKTVQFAAPTYVEASDYDYSTEDEEHAMIDPYGGAGAAEEPQQNGHAEDPDAAETKEEENDEDRPGTPTNHRGSFDREQAATHTPSIDEPQLSPKLIDKTEAAPLKSRKGTARNADSFLKDDSIETKKITITPGLLREDNISLKSASSESTRNASMENLVKVPSPVEEKGKKDVKEKKKEKQKGGMLSGLFKSKKKDKKLKEDIGNESDMEKPSLESGRESPRQSPLPSAGTSPVEKPASAVQPNLDTRQSVQAKQPSVRGRLQKQPPSQTSSPVREPSKDQANSAFLAELPAAEVAYEMATGHEAEISEPQQQPQVETRAVQQPEEKKESLLSPIRDMLTSSDKDPKPKKAKRSKQRVELDDFDSPADAEGPNPFKEQEERRRSSQDDGDGKERLSESPVEIMPGTFIQTPLATPSSFMHGTEIIHIPTPGPDDGDDEERSPESLTSSPSIIEHPAEPVEEEDSDVPEDNDPTPTASRSPQPITENSKPTAMPNRGFSTDSTDSSALLSPMHASTSSISPTPQPWSDSSLRAWLDDGSEVKDMLMMVHDKSGVTPVSDDHPMMAGLYVDQRKGVQKMMGDLDGLLGSYLKRKGISLG